MTVIEKNPDQIEKILIDNIKDENTIFIFSTDVAENSWIEHLVKNPETTGVRAVALDRFIAWDKFKENFVVAKEKGKHAIPSVLRKVFVYDIIGENGKLVKEGKESLFKSIINPLYADEAYSFVDWISKNIPMLKAWHEKFVSWCSRTGSTGDDEDADYELLYERYSEFLGDEMFEPSWETPDFDSSGKNFILFYPEQLEDYEDYREILKDAEHITAYVLPAGEGKHPQVIKYPDSRKELRRTVLKIRDLVETSSGKVSYEDIALTVPGIENLKPYIKRELEKYCVPYVIRTGDKLTVNSAASIFEDFKKCLDNDFSFESIRSLVLNEYIPWKEKEVNLNLVKEGQKHHIVCNRGKGNGEDEWIRTLSLDGKCERELSLYKKLKGSIRALCNAESFKNIKTSWFTFKADFLMEDGFSEAADRILGRCITELEELIDIEEDFIEKRNLKIHSPFDFYLNVLKSKSYRPQESLSGINVFDYKLSACAAYRYNFIINASQSELTVSYRPLSFINNRKRAALDIKDSDSASSAFIRLYGKFTDKDSMTVFSYGEDSFSGFAIPHNYLEECMADSEEEKLDEGDFIKQEKEYFRNGKKEPLSISERQLKEFSNWKKTADYFEVQDGRYEATPELKKRIREVLVENRSRYSEDKQTVRITQSDMENFFPCQRRWILGNVLRLNDDDLQSSLLTVFDPGNINHKTLELLFQALGRLPYVAEDNTFGEEDEKVRGLVRQSVRNAIHDPSMSFSRSPLVLEVLDSQSYRFEKVILSFLLEICSPVRSKLSLAGAEVYSTEKWFDSADKEKNLIYSGKIDCILKSPDGNDVIILDYKNTNVPSIKSCCLDSATGILENYQCAMYVNLWNLNNPGLKVSYMAFQSIQSPDKMSLVIDAGNSKKDLESFYPTLDVFESYAETFTHLVELSDFEPKKVSQSKKNDVDTYRDCGECPYKTICRTGYTVAGHSLSK